MREHGVDRIINLTGAGVPAPGDPPGPVHGFVRWPHKILQLDLLDDSLRQAALLRESGLRWTIVRGPRLTDKPARGLKHVGAANRVLKPFAARADVPQFMIEQVD